MPEKEQPFNDPPAQISIPLIKGKDTYIEKEAYVSKEDEDLAKEHTWHINSNGYAMYQRRIEGKIHTTFLHRKIAQRILERPLTKDDFIKPRNGNKLDSTRDNLEIITKSELSRRNHTNRRQQFLQNPQQHIQNLLRRRQS